MPQALADGMVFPCNHLLLHPVPLPCLLYTSHISEMEEKFPEAFVQFKNVCETLEKHYRDMQDMEFTVEHGKLYMLQTRNGKRTAKAALKIACDLVDEGMRTEEEAVAMIDPRNLDTLLHPQFDTAALKAATPIGKGLGASSALQMSHTESSPDVLHLFTIVPRYPSPCAWRMPSSAPRL